MVVSEVPDPTQTPPPAVMIDGTVLENIGKNLFSCRNCGEMEKD